MGAKIRMELIFLLLLLRFLVVLFMGVRDEFTSQNKNAILNY